MSQRHRQYYSLHKNRRYFYVDIAKDDETRLDTSNYDIDRPIPKVKNKRTIELMKDKLGGKYCRFSCIGTKRI